MCAAVPAMHEQMQEGTQKEQHIRQGAEDVRPVLSNEEKRRNGEKGEQAQPAWRPEPAPLLRWMLGGHRFLLLDAKRTAQQPHLASKGVLAGLIRHKLNGHDLTNGVPGTLVKIGKHDNCR